MSNIDQYIKEIKSENKRHPGSFFWVKKKTFFFVFLIGFSASFIYSSFNNKMQLKRHNKNKIFVISKTNHTMYTVLSGDTLQKISYKFYGSWSKWTFIAKVNSSIIKKNRIHPGDRLIIPKKEWLPQKNKNTIKK